MDESARRFWTRLLLVAMTLTAIWGAWVIVENNGRRGRIGFPPKQSEQEKGN